MNLIQKYTKSIALLAVLSMVLWTTGCAEQNTSAGPDTGKTTPGTALGENGGDEGADPLETTNPEAGSASPLGGDADRQAGSSLGGGVDFRDSESSSGAPDTEQK